MKYRLNLGKSLFSSQYSYNIQIKYSQSTLAQRICSRLVIVTPTVMLFVLNKLHCLGTFTYLKERQLGSS